MVGIKLTRGGTGRTHSWSTSDPDDVGNQVHQLIALLDREFESGRFRTPLEAAEHVAMASKGFKAIVEELRTISPRHLEGNIFRGRPFAPTNPPDSFGPPPSRSPNRFNVQGELAWYTSRTDVTVKAEISQSNDSDCCWVQRFHISGGAIKLLVLTPDSCGELEALNQFILMTERKVEKDLPVPAHPYIGTQFLRNLCEAAGFDALEYPTVTGDYASNGTATNVVFFTESAVNKCLGASVGEPYVLV
jgi:hypothetical protein